LRAEHFSPDAREFLRLLAAHGVRTLLIGELAVIYHGYARLTDFYYDRDPENVERLWAALVEFWDGSVPGIATSRELSATDVVVQFGRPPNRIDLISDLETIPFADAWNHRIAESIALPEGTIPVFIMGRSELIQSKRAAGRPKDLDDLEHLDPS
jgi:hypothetical protein